MLPDHADLSAEHFSSLSNVYRTQILIRALSLDPPTKAAKKVLMMISVNGAMTGSYDYTEVARSVLIAIAASYAALDLAGRVSLQAAGFAWLG